MTPPRGVGQFLHLECNGQTDADKSWQGMQIKGTFTLPLTGFKSPKRAVTLELGVVQWHHITDEVLRVFYLECNRQHEAEKDLQDLTCTCGRFGCYMVKVTWIW